MTLTFGTTTDGKSAVHVETNEDIHVLRDDHREWHDDALAVLTYPSKAIGFLSYDNPKMFGGLQFFAGATLTKDEAGNFGFCNREELIENA